MLLSKAERAETPACVALEAVPLWPLPLGEPPRIAWIGVGRHGRWAREDYRLPGLWCVHLYRWSGALRIGGAGTGTVAATVRPGHASVVPPDTPLSHFFTGSPGVGGAGTLVHLSAGFALGGVSAAGGDAPPVPLMQDLGDDFGRLSRLFEEAVAYHATAPRRAEARLWDLLWQIAGSGGGGRRDAPEATVAAEHAAVAKAREIIELRLGEPLRVAEIARAVDLSHNHLARLFRAATGRTVTAYIRERRIERADRLLRHSTLPLKSVAAQVGLPDPHQFNKAVRRATGLSPRALRGAGGAVRGPADVEKGRG